MPRPPREVTAPRLGMVKLNRPPVDSDRRRQLPRNRPTTQRALSPSMPVVHCRIQQGSAKYRRRAMSRFCDRRLRPGWCRGGSRYGDRRPRIPRTGGSMYCPAGSTCSKYPSLDRTAPRGCVTVASAAPYMDDARTVTPVHASVGASAAVGVRDLSVDSAVPADRSATATGCTCTARDAAPAAANAARAPVGTARTRAGRGLATFATFARVFVVRAALTYRGSDPSQGTSAFATVAHR